MEDTTQQQQTDNYQKFLFKRVKIILNSPKGRVTYTGVIQQIDINSLYIIDKFNQPVLLAKSDISQVFLIGDSR